MALSMFSVTMKRLVISSSDITPPNLLIICVRRESIFDSLCPALGDGVPPETE